MLHLSQILDYPVPEYIQLTTCEIAVDGCAADAEWTIFGPRDLPGIQIPDICHKTGRIVLGVSRGRLDPVG